MKHLVSLLTLLLATTISLPAKRSRTATFTTSDTSARATSSTPGAPTIGTAHGRTIGSLPDIDETFDPTQKNDLVMMSLYDLVYFYNLSYLHSLTPKIAVGGGFRLAHALGGTPGGSSIVFGFTLESRYYPGREGVKGIYFAPHASINRLREGIVSREYDPPTGNTRFVVRETTGLGLSIGAMAGWQFFPWEGLTVGAGLGFEHHILVAGNAAAGANQPFQEYDGISQPRVRFDIGYAW